MNPMILPKHHHVTTILICYVHERNGHCGVEQVLSLLREQLWVIKERAAVKEVIGRCTYILQETNGAKDDSRNGRISED